MVLLGIFLLVPLGVGSLATNDLALSLTVVARRFLMEGRATYFRAGFELIIGLAAWGVITNNYRISGLGCAC